MSPTGVLPLVLLLAVLAGGDRFTGLESPDAAKRRAAATRLAETPDPAMLGELIRAVRRETDDATRRAMIVALGRSGDRRAIGDVVRLLGVGGSEAIWAVRTLRAGVEPFDLDDTTAKARVEADRERAADEIREWWKKLPNRNSKEYGPRPLLLPKPADEPALLADLRSEDERIALRAAERLDPDRLTLEEIRIQAALLARAPHSWALQAPGRPLGSDDLPVLWERLVVSSLTPDDCQGRTHWALVPEHIPVIVALLPKANCGWFEEFVGLLTWATRDTDRYRKEAARGFLYALSRAEAESRGATPPPLPDLPPAGAGRGLPAAFVTLATHRLHREGRPTLSRHDPLDRAPSGPWLRRWARELVPVRSDLPFLVRVARRARFEEDRAWAVRCLGRLDDPAVTALLTRLAGLEGDEAAFAAAELARDGAPDRFLRILSERAGDEVPEMLAFDVMPEVARRRWLARLAEDPGREDWDRRPLDPGPEESAERLARFGIRFREEDREALAAALPVDRLPLETLSWFISEVSTSPLDGPALPRVLARLRGFCLEEDADPPEDLTALLGLIEVRDPDTLADLLHHWVEQREREQRDSALLLLARLGDRRFVAESIAAWSGDWNAGWLGRLRDPRVEAFLLEAARGDDPSRRRAALEALGVCYGLPEYLSLAVNWSREPAAAEKLMTGDAVGALLALEEFAWLVRHGAANDPRVIRALKMRRSSRADRWEAVAGLVRAGDEDAIEEVEGLVRDGRIWMYYPLQDAQVLSFGRAPEWIDFWVDHVDATCCIGFSALETLGELFPLLCVREVGNRTEVQELIVDWWRENRDRLAYSRILGGWIPGPPSGK